MREYCPICKHPYGTPWLYVKELKQHVCSDCYYDHKLDKKIKKEYLRRRYIKYGKMYIDYCAGSCDYFRKLSIDENRYKFFTKH